jgi:hypothetical protein
MLCLAGLTTHTYFFTAREGINYGTFPNIRKSRHAHHDLILLTSFEYAHQRRAIENVIACKVFSEKHTVSFIW